MRDVLLLSSADFQPTHLEPHQMIELVDVIRELGGDTVPKEHFAENVCRLLEDIPGFENAAETLVEKLVERLWLLFTAI